MGDRNASGAGREAGPTPARESEAPPPAPSAQAAAPATAEAPASTEAASAAEVDLDTLQATVAPGRTVIIGGKPHGPGRPVTLPRSDVKRLRRSGALVDPDAPERPRSNGAVFAKR